ncbi:MAG: glycosyltransferase family 4 protein [Elusimicrobia bacterium]|nr:glycosyltransferase family 4 protein [Elusimicrobiota bacterium]
MPDKKLKVMILAERFYPEEFIINDLAAKWSEKDFEIDVLTQAPSYPFGKIFKGYSNKLFSRDQWKNINILRFFTITGYKESLFLKLLNYFSFALVGSIVALFIGRKYDRVFVYHVGPLTLAIPAVVIGKIYKKDVTIWTQDVWPDSVYAYGFRKRKFLSAILDGFVSFVYRNCDRIFVSCEGFRQKITPYAPCKPVYHFPNWPVIPQGVESDSKRIKLSDKFNFTFAGNVGKVQNLENVVRGFSMASAKNENIQLNIIGDGSNLENLKEIIDAEKISNVVFWGRRNQQEMPAYFNASDVMVISLNDAPIFTLTVPSKFQSYLAAGKPIFCIMNGEVRRIVEQYQTGLCAAPGDLKGIMEVFLEFYSLRSGGLQSFVKNSRILLDSIYDRGKIVDSMTNLIIDGRLP